MEIIFILSGKYKILRLSIPYLQELFNIYKSHGLPLSRIDGRGILLTLSWSREECWSGTAEQSRTLSMLGFFGQSAFVKHWRGIIN